MNLSAMISIILALNPRVPMHRAIRISNSLDQYCIKPLHPYALAIISAESDFQPHAVSPTGDVGLFQLSPKFHKDLTLEQRRDIDKNIQRGCGVLFEAFFHYSSRHPNDWYGFYHSHKLERRQAYVKRVDSKMKVVISELRRFEDEWNRPNRCQKTEQNR